MKSVYIVTGGILAVIAVVFLAPQKQNNPEEKASKPLDEIDAHILKEFGPDLTPEQKEWARQDVADQLALEKAEMRKYGRLLTPDERSEQWWREQDEAEEKAAWSEFYAERKDWIDNFPFQPRYHPEIVYDPANIAHSDAKYRAYRKELEKKADDAFETYEAESEKLWARTDLTPEEKHAEDERLFCVVELADEAIQNPDPEIMADWRVIMRHKRLDGFYKQDYHYRPEFEQAYRIFKEEGAGDNPVQIADTMVALASYFVASKHDPNKLHPTSEIWDDKIQDWKQPTWCEKMKSAYECIAGNMDYKPYLLPGEKPLTEEQINRIRDRLIAEIPPDGFTGNTFLFGLVDPKDEDMVPGQSLLVE